MKNILMIQYQRKKQTINSLLEYHMAGDERIELPTVVLEDMKTPVIKYQIPIKPSQTAN